MLNIALTIALSLITTLIVGLLLLWRGNNVVDFMEQLPTKHRAM